MYAGGSGCYYDVDVYVEMDVSEANFHVSKASFLVSEANFFLSEANILVSEEIFL